MLKGCTIAAFALFFWRCTITKYQTASILTLFLSWRSK